MSDPDFWKQQYQHAWAKASEREKTIKARILNESGKQVELVGLGAGSTDFLSGTAASQGYQKGDADLYVVGTNIFLEVTGPQSKVVRLEDPLWVRPDKVTSARTHLPSHETWVVHWLERDGSLRVIPLNEAFFDLLDRNVFSIVHPVIRGVRETYLAIPASHFCVKSWDALIARLKQLP